MYAKLLEKPAWASGLTGMVWYASPVQNNSKTALWTIHEQCLLLCFCSCQMVNVIRWKIFHFKWPVVAEYIAFYIHRAYFQGNVLLKMCIHIYCRSRLWIRSSLVNSEIYCLPLCLSMQNGVVKFWEISIEGCIS